LEQNFQTRDTPESRNVFEGQLRECYGRTVYSHKTHEKCADILLGRLSNIKMAQIVLSVLTTGTFISTFFGSGAVGAAIGTALSTLLLMLNAYTKNYDLGELAQKHKQAANDIWLVREKYLTILTDVAMGQRPLEALQVERDTLLEQLHNIYAGSPSTSYKAYKKAQEALKRNEDMTFTDTEIDAFLPPQLRRGV